MKRKYKEIFKLKKMLEKEKIPFDWIENFGYTKSQMKDLRKHVANWEHFQICYPKGSFYKESKRWISVIEGFGTYGAEQDKLEIMGGLAPWEKYGQGEENDNRVLGYLTADDVFDRIKNNWEEGKSNDKKCFDGVR